MECPKHPGFELPVLIEDKPPCDKCGADPAPAAVGFGPCRIGGETYDLLGNPREVAVVESDAPPAEAAKPAKGGKKKEG